MKKYNTTTTAWNLILHLQPNTHWSEVLYRESCAIFSSFLTTNTWDISCWYMVFTLSVKFHTTVPLSTNTWGISLTRERVVSNGGRGQRSWGLPDQSQVLHNGWFQMVSMLHLYLVFRGHLRLGVVLMFLTRTQSKSMTVRQLIIY